jgi:hypothetical protein
VISLHRKQLYQEDGPDAAAQHTLSAAHVNTDTAHSLNLLKCGISSNISTNHNRIITALATRFGRLSAIHDLNPFVIFSFPDVKSLALRHTMSALGSTHDPY